MSVNLYNIVAEYVARMVPDDGSMKVLLLDEFTLDCVSLSFSQTQLLKRGVFLVDRVDSQVIRGPMPTMRCCIFVRPTSRMVDCVCQEVRAARYSSYHVIFSNVAPMESLDALAKADGQCLVGSVEEYFADFSVTNLDVFTLPLKPHHVLLPILLPAAHIERVAQGLAATFVALRRKPHVRFQKNSAYARRVATELLNVVKMEPDLYAFKTRDTVLLINDRADDPVTPILTPWTYQAMLHELVGINDNRVRLPEMKKEEDEYCFSEHDDTFFAENMFVNWGDLCSNVKAFVDTCKTTLHIDRSTATMEDLKQFMQKLPQTKTLTGSVTKHATVVSHLANVIKQRCLLDVSLLEQDMVSTSSATEHWNRLTELARRTEIVRTDILRLCLIYHMRYEKVGLPSRTEELLPTADERLMLRKIREYYGDRSTDQLFASTGMMSSIVKTFSDVGNIYTQHEPALKKVLHALALGKLDSEAYPYSPIQPSTPPPNYRPKEVVVFTCGGITFAECALARSINKGTAFASGPLTLTAAAAADFKVVIGGTAIHNSTSFLQQLSLHP